MLSITRVAYLHFALVRPFFIYLFSKVCVRCVDTRTDRLLPDTYLRARRGVGRMFSAVDSHFYKLRSMYGRKWLRTWSSRSIWIWLRLKLNECIKWRARKELTWVQESTEEILRMTDAIAFWFIYDSCGYIDFISGCT
jgi:hypothetical protein